MLEIKLVVRQYYINIVQSYPRYQTSLIQYSWIIPHNHRDKWAAGEKAQRTCRKTVQMETAYTIRIIKVT